jgi:hypothetical protein
VPCASIDPVQKAYFCHPESDIKLGLKKLRDEKGETETEGGELGVLIGCSRLASFNFVKLPTN